MITSKKNPNTIFKVSFQPQKAKSQEITIPKYEKVTLHSSKSSNLKKIRKLDEDKKENYLKTPTHDKDVIYAKDNRLITKLFKLKDSRMIIKQSFLL